MVQKEISVSSVLWKLLNEQCVIVLCAQVLHQSKHTCTTQHTPSWPRTP